MVSDLAVPQCGQVITLSRIMVLTSAPHRGTPSQYSFQQSERVIFDDDHAPPAKCWGLPSKAEGPASQVYRIKDDFADAFGSLALGLGTLGEPCAHAADAFIGNHLVDFESGLLGLGGSATRAPIFPFVEHVAKVIARAPGLFSTMIAAARATGACPEELAVPCICSSIARARRLAVVGKRNKLRVIDLNPFGRAVIFESIPPGIAKAPLFWHRKGERCANVSSRFASLTAELAEADQDFVRFRFHDQRQLHAVEWLRSGRSIYACSNG
jgi:hypothetical protein